MALGTGDDHNESRVRSVQDDTAALMRDQSLPVSVGTIARIRQINRRNRNVHRSVPRTRGPGAATARIVHALSMQSPSRTNAEPTNENPIFIIGSRRIEPGAVSTDPAALREPEFLRQRDAVAQPEFMQHIRAKTIEFSGIISLVNNLVEKSRGLQFKPRINAVFVVMAIAASREAHAGLPPCQHPRCKSRCSSGARPSRVCHRPGPRDTFADVQGDAMPCPQFRP